MIIAYIICTLINISYISAQMPADESPYLSGAPSGYIQKSARMDITDGDVVYDSEDGDVMVVLAFFPVINLVFMSSCAYSLIVQSSGGMRWARRIKEWQMLNRIKIS